MQLRRLNYLFEHVEASRDRESSTRRGSTLSAWLKPLWIVPRAWCATTVLQAKGVPRHKTTAFVRLHLSRLAPFADCGVYAARAGDIVHIWFWENQRVRDFCAKHDIEFSSLLLAPESVCLPKVTDGAILHRCAIGIEAQLWRNGTLQDSVWWSSAVSQEDWQSWQAKSVAADPGRAAIAPWPQILPQFSPTSRREGFAALASPWGSNLLADQWWRNWQQLRLGGMLTLVAAVLMGTSGYWCAQWITLQRAQENIDQKIALLSNQVEPLTETRNKALAALQWTTQIANLRSNPSIGAILDSLYPLLEQQDAALREFEFVDDEIRLTMVPMTRELNIAAVIQQMEAHPELMAIRLLPDSDLRLLRVSAKLRSTMNNAGKHRAVSRVSPSNPTVTDAASAEKLK